MTMIRLSFAVLLLSLTYLGGQAYFRNTERTVQSSIIKGKIQDTSQEHSVSNSKLLIDDELKTFIEDLMKVYGVHGLTLGIVFHGQEEFGGFRVSTEDGDLVGEETLFSIGSCSKAYTAAALGILIDNFEGGANETPLPPNLPHMHWTTKIKDILGDDWKLPDQRASDQTNILDLLTHMTGFPKRKYQYNNLMYIVASYIVEIYSGTDFTTFVTDRILEPANMTNSVYFASEASRIGRLSHGWDMGGRRIPYVFSSQASKLTAGEGSLISNACDMVKWLRILLNEGTDPKTNNTVIPEATIQEILGAHVVTSPASLWPELSITTYGFGWAQNSYRGHNRIGHAGGVSGFTTLVTFYPDDGLGIFVSTNTGLKSPLTETIVNRISEDALGLRRINWTDRYGFPDPPAELPNTPSGPSEPAVEDLYGTYFNEGYGNLTLCHSSSVSEECRKVQGAFAPFMIDRAPEHTLFAAWPKTWVTHTLVTRVYGPFFFASLLSIHGNGYDSCTVLREESDAVIGRV
ncbi:beta-lactamase/transpeptidase-like protein [Sistotremastrum niveocremeum HHB9708]|uniref:Beta-lactamase/transpeptidase-like protein n=1 Tax=Sistotremastrum niveocremeum HHB9708 TaxID=1314777 RepID=A0A164X653_9AGAM|nr:beta-lactamase/transpeptidase-like protein [Sistotremastrum niveocremeum HHB9708]